MRKAFPLSLGKKKKINAPRSDLKLFFLWLIQSLAQNPTFGVHFFELQIINCVKASLQQKVYFKRILLKINVYKNVAFLPQMLLFVD